MPERADQPDLESMITSLASHEQIPMFPGLRSDLSLTDTYMVKSTEQCQTVSLSSGIKSFRSYLGHLTPLHGTATW